MNQTGELFNSFVDLWTDDPSEKKKHEIEGNKKKYNVCKLDCDKRLTNFP
jgi:hypothetical protein